MDSVTAALPTAFAAFSQNAAPQNNRVRPALSEDEQAQVRKLQARDREVRAHEQAHLAAAGGLAVSGAIYTYQRGPDGRNYAVGGEVKISASPGRTPEETLQRAQTIRAAALAPVDPSSADLAAAAQAGRLEQQARVELSLQQREETQAAQDRLSARYDTGANPPPAQVDVFA